MGRHDTAISRLLVQEYKYVYYISCNKWRVILVRKNMNIQELTTWTRLSTLNFDAADAVFQFPARLARENGWSRAFAAKAVDEYRKFCFLAVHAGHPVTPSDEVDQVWHLHLTYSRHYWDTLCRDTLERPLDHGPTKGGAAEDCKFHDWYEATLASYRRYFGEPPNDVWPGADERFDASHDFLRIDRRDVVTLDRTVLKRSALASLVGGGVLAVAHAVAQGEGAADAAPEIGFVVVLTAALIVAFIVAVARTRRRKPRGAAAKRRANDGAIAAGGATGAGGGSSGKSSDGDGNGDANGGADGGAGGCGSSGCGGGGGG
jgi:hypothetical protein